jgi:nicotinate-nucleotide pyrophosphorylase (carboxylating)
MVDTGRLADLAAVARLGESCALGAQAQVAYAGNVGPASLDGAIEAGATILDVGRAILDAPMIDLRLDVT